MNMCHACTIEYIYNRDNVYCQTFRGSPQGDEHRTCFLGVLEKRLDTYIRALFEVVLYKTNNALYASKIETMRYPKIMHSCSL